MFAFSFMAMAFPAVKDFRDRPGAAMLDCGSTWSLIGASNLQRQLDYFEEQRQKHSLEVDVREGASGVTFRGVTGNIEAIKTVYLPVVIGGHLGCMAVHVIPGDAPWLISIYSLT